MSSSGEAYGGVGSSGICIYSFSVICAIGSSLGYSGSSGAVSLLGTEDFSGSVLILLALFTEGVGSKNCNAFKTWSFGLISLIGSFAPFIMAVLMSC